MLDALAGENPWINTSYHFHGFAPNQADDTKFRDISGNGNDGFETAMGGTPIARKQLLYR